MTDDERAAIERAAEEVALATLHSLDGKRPSWKHDSASEYAWREAFRQAAIRTITAELSPLLAAKDERIAELEGMLHDTYSKCVVGADIEVAKGDDGSVLIRMLKGNSARETILSAKQWKDLTKAVRTGERT